MPVYRQEHRHQSLRETPLRITHANHKRISDSRVKGTALRLICQSECLIDLWSKERHNAGHSGIARFTAVSAALDDVLNFLGQLLQGLALLVEKCVPVINAADAGNHVPYRALGMVGIHAGTTHQRACSAP